MAVYQISLSIEHLKVYRMAEEAGVGEGAEAGGRGVDVEGEGVSGSFALRNFLEIRMARDGPQEYIYECVMY